MILSGFATFFVTEKGGAKKVRRWCSSPVQLVTHLATRRKLLADVGPLVGHAALSAEALVSSRCTTATRKAPKGFRLFTMRIRRRAGLPALSSPAME